MNVKLLRKVKKHILAEPKRFCFHWARKSLEAPCGTRACIAGWTIILGAGLMEPFDADGDLVIPKSLTRNKMGYYSGPASKLLGITEEQADRLFVYWPSPFKDRGYDAKTAAARIEHFIKTEGKE